MIRQNHISWLTLLLMTGCFENIELPGEAVDTQTVSDAEATDASSVFDFGNGPNDSAEGDAGTDDIGIPPSTCTTDADCDDGLACTLDTCADVDGVSACTWTVTSGTCLINSVCYDALTAADGEPCLRCNPEASNTGWTREVGAALCDDGDACTTDDVCTEDGCVGSELSCDDDLECTTDSCVAGECQFVAVACDDDNPCTDDTCDDSGACAFTPNSEACDADGDACTNDVCTDGACNVGPALDCDDGDICTIDLCDSDVGCVQLPTQTPCCSGEVSLCDDGDPCTDDLCDEVTGECSAQLNTAPCDDGDACTEQDACLEGTCAGVATTCDDGNPCTLDSCDGGCQHAPLNDGPCDDGLECSTGDTCQAGICVGDESACVCVPTFSTVANKINALAIGENADAGQGLDLDGDPTTCAPAPCTSGVDNALSLVAGFANAPLADTVADGGVLLVLEHRNFPVGGGDYTVALYQSALAPGNETCDFQTETCGYTIEPALLDPTTCAPLIELPTTLTDNQLTGGGPGTVFPFSIPLSDTATISIVLFDAQISATVEVVDGLVVSMTGLLGGAVQKEDLKSAIASLPADALPLPPEQIAPLLDTLIQNDIDTNGDGVPDAASIGITLTAIGANIVGLSQ